MGKKYETINPFNPEFSKANKFEDIMSKDDRTELDVLIKKIREMWTSDTMTPMQRIFGAMTGQDIDRVPSALYAPNDKFLKAAGGNYTSYFTNPVVYIKAMLMAVLKFKGESLVPFLPADNLVSDSYNCKMKFYEDSLPSVYEFGVKGFEDLLEHDVPDPKENQGIKWQILTIKYLTEKLGDLCGLALCAFQCGPYYTYLSQLRGPIDGFRDIKKQPELATQVFDKVYEYNLAALRYMIEMTGSPTFVLIESMAAPQYTSPTWYEKYCAPYQRKVLKDLAPTMGVIAGGGQGQTDFTPLLETFAEMGYSSFSFGPPTDRKKMKQISMEKGIFYGEMALTQQFLRDATPQEIDEQVKEILKIGAPGKLYAMGSDLIDRSTPDENLYAAREALIKYGSYF